MAGPDERKRESGVPGGGAGRRDETSRRGIFPYSVKPAPAAADPELRTPASITPTAPYDESGESELWTYAGEAQPAGAEAALPREPTNEPREAHEQTATAESTKVPLGTLMPHSENSK